MTKSVRATFTVIAASLALGACGGGDKSPDTPAARKAVLVLADLPAGWTASDNGDVRSEARLCPSVKRARDGASGRASSKQFDHVPTGQATSSVYVYADEARARTAYRDLTSQGTWDCLGSREFDVLDANAAKNVKLGDTILTDRPIDPVGTQRHVSHVTILYTTPRDSLAVGTDFVFVRQGRGIATLILIDERSSSFDESVRNRLGRIAARKLRDALATG